jgi:hypothetical protein
MTWKAIMDELDPEDEDAKAFRKRMVKTRNEFVDYMNKQYCPRLCVFDGSTNSRSDIDIAIKNRQESRYILRNVNAFINDTFKGIFTSNTVRQARKFLDLNHYISNFDISSWDLRSCASSVTSGGIIYYLSSQNNKLQRYYALNYWRDVQQTYFASNLENESYNFIEQVKHKAFTDDKVKKCIEEGFDDYHVYVCLYQHLMDKIKTCDDPSDPSYQNNIDYITNVVSLMTGHEDEGYMTQASFYRWVKKVKAIPYYMQVDCVLEHLCMAFAHSHDPYSYCKYLSRAINVAYEMGDVNIVSAFQPNGWWGDIKSYLGKKGSLGENEHKQLVDDLLNRDEYVKPQGLRNILHQVITNVDKLRDYFGLDMVLLSKLSGGKNEKIRILGRLRKIVKIGRKNMVMYKGKLITVGEARKLEKHV